MKTKIENGFRLTIPLKYREELGIKQDNFVIWNVKDGKLAEIETLSPIKVVGGLSDHEIYAEIRKRHKEENVLPYKVEKHSELYMMTLTDFMGNAELKERTLIQPK